MGSIPTIYKVPEQTLSMASSARYSSLYLMAKLNSVRLHGALEKKEGIAAAAIAARVIARIMNAMTLPAVVLVEAEVIVVA